MDPATIAIYGIAAVLLILLTMKLVKGMVKMGIIAALILILLGVMGVFDPLGVQGIIEGIFGIAI